MLVASSLPNFENAGTPRVISEIRKKSPVKPRESIRPRISSELLVLCATENRWWPRRVQVRAGQLLVGNSSGETSVGSFRLPLRHLSLAAGPLPNSLALHKGQNVVLTLQTASEAAFDLWVKAIAIEIIRQTPLDAVRYLDILTVQECWNRRKTQDCEKDCNFNCTSSETSASECSVCTTKDADFVPSTQTEYMSVDENDGTNEKHKETRSPQPEVPPRPISKRHYFQEMPKNNAGVWNVQQNRLIEKNDRIATRNERQSKENSFEILLRKCQSSENYVPVREKLLLFETLCKLGRDALSTEDVSKSGFKIGKKAISMHDLTHLPYSSPGVRQICKYFENKTDLGETKKFGTICRTNRRLINSDTQLHDAQKVLNYPHYVRVS